MLIRNMALDYSLALMLSTGKKSFENIGRSVKRSGDTVFRWLRPAAESFDCMQLIAREFFKNSPRLFFLIDDTVISKIYSQQMEGSMDHYHMKLGKQITAYKLMVGSLTDGKYTVPLSCSFVFPKEVESTASIESKDDITKRMILIVQQLFPNKKIIVCADGAFATKILLAWCIEKNIAAEVRMHSNRKVQFKGQLINIRDIKELQPKGRRRARTIEATWYGITLYITAHRRIDTNHNESIVFQAATYRAKSIQHVKNYRRRWGIEKLFRTTKQHLGLQECFSTKLETQHNHMAAVLLAYSIAQLERKKRKLNTPEKAIRALSTQKYHSLKQRLSASDQIFGVTHA